MNGGVERSDRRGAPAASLAAAALVFLCCQFLLGDLRSGQLAPGILDPDSYTRLLRVERMLSGGGWYDGSLTWSNAPYGDTLHWTRLYDLLVAAGALPLSRAMGLRAAVWTAGSALPVLLGLATIGAVAWGARRRLGARGVALLGFLAGAQPTLPLTFKWSSVDHHALVIFLFAAGWAGAVRGLDSETGPGARVAGVAAGLALWVSVESLAWIAAVAAVFVLLWVWQGAGAHARSAAAMLAAAAGTAAVALAVERPPGEWLAVETDRISVAHVALLAAFAIAWAFVSTRLLRWASATPGRRWAVGAAACAGPGVAVIAAFPKLLRGPVADVDPRVIPLLFDFNGEFVAFAPGDLVYLGMFASAAGPAIGAALLCVLGFRRAGAAGRRLAVLTVALVLVFLPLAMYQWRWARYLNVVALLPWALVIRWVWRWPPAARYRGLRLPAAAALAVGHLVLAVGLARIHFALARGAAAEQVFARSAAASSPAPLAPGVGEPRRLSDPFSFRPVPCSHRSLGPELSALAGRRAGELVVMTTMFEGPRLVWETGVRVVGTPYHRNAAGILDTDVVMAKADGEAAREVLEARGVDFLVVCPTSSSVALLSRTSPQGLAARLARGEIPSWLETVAAGGAAGRSVRAFRIRHAPHVDAGD